MGGQKAPSVKTNTPAGFNQALEGQTAEAIPSYFGDPNSGYYRYLQQLSGQLGQFQDQQTKLFQQVTANAASNPAGAGDINALQKSFDEQKAATEADQGQKYISQSWQGVMKMLNTLGGEPMEQKTKVQMPNAALNTGGQLFSQIGGMAMGYGAGAKG